MRLATLLLIGCLASGFLAAQDPAASTAALPWKAAAALPWQLVEAGPAPPPFTAAPTQTVLDLTVRLDADGALRVTDATGLIRLRAGLPGRPLRAWRDWGIPVPDPTAPMRFPGRTPLQQGIGSMPVGTADFRAGLEGLLWILDDDEAYLTVVHPATAQVVHLPMPGGQNLALALHPDRLEVRERPVQAGPRQTGPDQPVPDARGPASDMAWTLHWVALLPQFIQLGKDSAAGRPRGTALAPFPRE